MGLEEKEADGVQLLPAIPVMLVRHSGVLMIPAIEKPSAIIQRINTPRLDKVGNKSLEVWQA